MRSGSPGDRVPYLKLRCANGDEGAARYPQAAEQERIGRHPEAAILERQRFAQRLPAVESERAIERIAPVDRLDFRQDGGSVGHRHSAQGRRLADHAEAVHERLFACRGLAVNEREFDIAAEDWLAFFVHAAIDSRAERADRRNDGSAESEADQKDPETLEPGAQIAPREPEPEKGRHEESPETICPSRTSTMRSQRAATSRSWVMRRSVVSCSR